jgi:hypothetical protein
MLMDVEINRPRRAVMVPCRDIARRPRGVWVIPLLDQRLMVVTPPGEVAELTLEEAEALQRALRAAVPLAAVECIPKLRVLETFTCAVPCSDALGRRRAMTIAGHDGRVVVAAPAGGIAVFRPLGVDPFRAALHAAIGDSHIEAVIA